MGWPQSQEYNEAIQSPSSSFADPELCTGEVVTNARGAGPCDSALRRDKQLQLFTTIADAFCLTAPDHVAIAKPHVTFPSVR